VDDCCLKRVEGGFWWRLGVEVTRRYGRMELLRSLEGTIGNLKTQKRLIAKSSWGLILREIESWETK